MTAAVPPDDVTGSGPVTVSVAIQMNPLWRFGQPGQAWAGELPPYAEQLTRWLVRNLEPFTEARGGDLFVAVVVGRDGEEAGHEYRDGHYVKADAAGMVPG